jgi:Fe2+ or Zn2+ uptake regulation protein
MDTQQTQDVAEIRERLRQAGLQTTAVRLAVMRLLKQANAPLSCSQIANAIIPLGYQRSAFPKVLGRLVEAGLIHQMKHGAAPRQFQWMGQALTHFEFQRNGVAIAGVA